MLNRSLAPFCNIRKEKQMDSKNNSGLFQGLKNNQKYTLVLMAALAVCLVICIILLVVASIDFSVEDPDTDDSANINDLAIGATAAQTVTEDQLLGGTLALVNKDHKFNLTSVEVIKLYEYRNANSADSSSKAYMVTGQDNGHDVMVTEETAINLHNMLTDMYKSTKAVGFVAAGYRSFDEQTTDKPAASGYSDFHTGMLVSLKAYVGGSTLDITNESNEAMYTWLLTNAHKYGFIQRYPAGKEDKTGVSDYLSCFRYVGVAHATYMKSNNLCLEEYIALIEKQKPTIESPMKIEVKNGSTKEYYAVYYYAYNGGSQEIQVPTSTSSKDGSEANNYTVSGTNAGGIIVTVKLK